MGLCFATRSLSAARRRRRRRRLVALLTTRRLRTRIPVKEAILQSACVFPEVEEGGIRVHSR